MTKRTISWAIALALAVSGSVLGARPQGFAIADLKRLKIKSVTIAGKIFDARTSARRATFLCAACAEVEAVDVLLDESSDGTEARFRSGVTTIQSLEAQCQQRDESCKLEKIVVNGAVGWISRARAAGSAISTTVLFKNGDRLIIRSIAASAQSAYDNGKAIGDKFAAKIVG